MKKNFKKIVIKAWEIRRAASKKWSCPIMEISWKDCFNQAKSEILNNLIDRLTNAGCEWKNYGKERIYFDTADLIGLTYGQYKTGNISYAEINGEKISNAECRRILKKISGKAFYDIQSKEFVCYNCDAEYKEIIIEKMKSI